MKYLSLFSGIGGFELGIGEKGECVGFSEINKYATEIYKKRFPNHKNYGDITKIDPADLPDFDLLVGGFPCQAFSIAGQRQGFNDTRGTLFFEIARVLRWKCPRLILLENVKGLLSHENGDTFKTIIATLTELGYDLQWQVLNSKDFGVAQNRERVYIVGHLRGTPRPKVFPLSVSNAKDIIQLNSPTHSNDRIYDVDGLSPTLNTMQGGRRQPFVALTEKRTEEAKAIRRSRKDKDFSPRRGKYLEARTDGKIGALTSSRNLDHLLSDSTRVRRLTPLECERLQSFPDGWTEGVSDTQRYKTLGNAVTVNVIKAIIEKLC